LRKNAKMVLAFLLFISLVLQSFSSMTYTIGVKEGDWADYDFFFDWMSTPPQPEPPEAEQEKQVNYTRIIITKIVGTVVTFHKICYFKNGSQELSVHVGDVVKGTGNLSLQIIPSNLDKGDKVSEASGSPIICETNFEEYAGALREVNFNRTSIQWGFNLTIIDLYWDRKTGILCELIILTDTFSENYNFSSLAQWKIIRTNLWEPETSDPLLKWIGIIILSISVIVIITYFSIKKTIVKRYKKKRTKKVVK